MTGQGERGVGARKPRTECEGWSLGLKCPQGGRQIQVEVFFTSSTGDVEEVSGDGELGPSQGRALHTLEGCADSGSLCSPCTSSCS